MTFDDSNSCHGLTRRRIERFARVVAIVALAASGAGSAFADGTWPAYGGAPGGGQYSPSAQITRDNVARLKPLWTFHTGELGAGLARPGKLTFESNAILAEGRLYLITALNKVFALDPATGRELWQYDAAPGRGGFSELAARGVSSWLDAAAPAGTACRHRIFFGTLDARLIALDGATGQPCPGFGTTGVVDLKAGIRLHGAGNYLVTSPPAIVGDVVVLGSAIGDNRAADLEAGVVRAFDARTGRQRWSWDPVPRADAAEARARGWSPDQAGRTGAANAWAPMAVDAALGLVYVPTGSASPDFYGGERLGDNRDANSLVALRAASGEVAWRRQLVHHDLWDYDLAAQPVLADIALGGRPRKAVLQATKTGMLFIFDRETGEPLLPIEERAVPASDVPGEQASPTQPFVPEPFVFVRHGPVREADAWGLTPIDRAACRRKIAPLRSEGLFTPPSLRGTIAYPSWAGGVNWSGIAFDPQRQRVLIAAMELPMAVTLVPRVPDDRLAPMAASGDFKGSEFARMEGTPYGMRRETLLSPLGIPCTAPPWGKLLAIDLREGRRLWERPLGTTAEKAPIAIELGMPFFGGPVATASGLIFMAGATDQRLRAFDADDGRVLWEAKLPAGGNATPSVFEHGGRQIVVIAAGGHGPLGAQRGDAVIAFALP